MPVIYFTLLRITTRYFHRRLQNLLLRSVPNVLVSFLCVNIITIIGLRIGISEQIRFLKSIHVIVDCVGQGKEVFDNEHNKKHKFQWLNVAINRKTLILIIA